MRSVPSTAVPWLEQLVAGISPRITGFDPRSIHVIYGGQSVKGISFFPSTSVSVSIIPLISHTHSFIYMLLLPEGQTGQT